VSFLPVHLQLPSNAARLPQMVVPACMRKHAQGSVVRLIL
jgi:hypothetical protein